MRIVNRQELMSLPAGTLFCPVNQPWCFDQARVKDDSIRWPRTGAPAFSDYYENALDTIDAHDSGEHMDRLDAMRVDSTLSYEWETAPIREGLFDDDAQYLIFEQRDIDLLIEKLRGAYTVHSLDTGRKTLAHWVKIFRHRAGARA